MGPISRFLYRNNLKNRNFGKEGPQNLHSERATIAERQGASENANFEVNPTRPKTDFSGYFGIRNKIAGIAFLWVLLVPCFFYGAPKVEVFVRHCHFSSVSQYKNRPAWFSREVCNRNLINTIDRDFVNVTYVLDTFHRIRGEHFVKKQDRYRVVEIREGSEAKAFLRLIDYISSLNLDPETIVYIVEDDYLHRPGWVDILVEGFSIPGISYVTLYDHKDKYYFPMYEPLQAKLYHTRSCHWRVTPSTTNTYAMKFKTLLRDLGTHRGYSLNTDVTADHAKFCSLGAEGKLLISPLPGWSTHLEPEYFAPCIDWEAINNAYR